MSGMAAHSPCMYLRFGAQIRETVAWMGLVAWTGVQVMQAGVMHWMTWQARSPPPTHLWIWSPFSKTGACGAAGAVNATGALVALAVSNSGFCCSLGAAGAGAGAGGGGAGAAAAFLTAGLAASLGAAGSALFTTSASGSFLTGCAGGSKAVAAPSAFLLFSFGGCIVLSLTKLDTQLNEATTASLGLSRARQCACEDAELTNH